MASRALTVAVWILGINTSFTLLNYVNPFHAASAVLTDPLLFNSTFTAMAVNQTSGIGPFGLVLEFVGVLNLLLSLIYGPLTLVPALMGMIGYTGIWVIAVTGLVWIPYTFFLVQLVTGRVFMVTK
jgi:hypothetical protein